MAANMAMRERIDAFFCEELNACEEVDDQQDFIVETMKMAMGAYTIRYRDAPQEIKVACIRDLFKISTLLVELFRVELLQPDETKGFR